jgi:dTDP-4-amino-4,6-dideoxygalactose transaminase
MATTSLTRETVVPFVDLGPSHGPLRARLVAELEALLANGAFTNGPPVAEFERSFADYCGRRHCVGLASGLDALRLCLLAAGLRPGDEVIVPANTFFASFEAVSQAGGIPVPVDAAEDDYNINVDRIAAAVGPRTRFIMPVHLYGQLADMAAIHAVAQRHGLAVLEDACQAHGARRAGLPPGELSLAAAFSFYPGKNLGALGDAGALVTDDEALAGVVRALREHGQRAKYRHDLIGYTARLDTFQAAALLCKLPLLDGWNDERRAVADAYLKRLEGVGDLRLPEVADGSEHVWHLFVVRTGNPEGLASHLREHGVGSGRHYPEPPHLSRPYRSLGHAAGSFPVAERLARETLSLPMFPGMTSEQVETVIGAVQTYFERG